jgi:HlyD family secretion protein
MRLISAKPISGLAILVVAALVVAWKWRAGNGHEVAYATALVKREDIVATISATGTVEPVEVVDVGAQVAGLIQSFGKDTKGGPIDYGSMVEEGSILARIDDSVYAADLDLATAQVEQNKAGEQRAAADLDQMKAKAAQTEADWKRAKELTASKLMATADYDSYFAANEMARANVSVGEAALAQARASTIQAQATLVKARRNLDFCTIKSPVKGVIIDRRVNIGQTVVASLNAPSLFLIAKDLTKMQVWVAVNEADVGRISPGAAVTFKCDAFPNSEFKGSVGKVRLNATMTQNVVMYTVEVNTENQDDVLLPYLTAIVRFVANRQTNAMVVPNAALRWRPSSMAQVSPESRSLFSQELNSTNTPAGQSQSSGNAQAASPNRLTGRIGMVWLKDGQFVRPLEVQVGTTDGTNTAVSAEALMENQEVVISEVVEAAAAATQNPFVPQFRRR